MQYHILSNHLIPLRYKYLPQHPVLKHPQSMFLLKGLGKENESKGTATWEWRAESKEPTRLRVCFRQRSLKAAEFSSGHAGVYEMLEVRELEIANSLAQCMGVPGEWKL
jgi:hypothetical protein